MKDMLIDEFQYTISELLVRNKSILDCLSKYQDSNANANRAITKAVTHCGCVKVTACKQEAFKLDCSEMNLSTHIDGTLCDSCKDNIEKQIGKNLFYLSSLCNILDLNLYDILIKELNNIKVLGKYNLR